MSDTIVDSSGDASEKSAIQEEPPVEPVAFKPGRDFFLAFAALSILMLAVALDATSLGVALPIMSTELGGTALQAFWSGTSYLLASTVLQPSFASMSAIVGRKYVVYVSCLLFTIGSIVCAVAQNFTVLLVGRSIQGIGGGGIIALSEVIVTDLVPLAVRGQWLSILSAMWAIGTVAGPLMGAGFAQHATWRWIFWINLPLMAVGVLMIYFFLNQTELPGNLRTKLARFDWFGSFLFTAGSTILLFGISTGGVMYDWGSFRTLLPLILGILTLPVFAYWELHWAKEPVIDRGIFRNWTMIANYIMTVFHGMILWSLIYFLILYYQGVKFYSPIISALACLPESLTVAPAGIVVGVIAAITGHYRWSLWTGWALTTLGAGLLYLLNPDTPVRYWIPLNLPIGVGTGMLFPAMALSIQAACAPHLNAQAAAFFAFLRTFGQSVGVAVAGVIFQNAFADELAATTEFAAVADQYADEATIVIGIINGMAPGHDRTVLVAAYADALKTIWLSLLAFAAFCLVLSASVKSYSLQQAHDPKQALVTKQRDAAAAKRATADVEAATVKA
ncbi:MFS transporter L2 like protein [Verticillium longisporum]|uniref:MFS transporter L2 like protein n=1 Tax=Verticillium longisporum TaxID=100787 RepID=A0A8I3AN55_VERLO|nr:MFS transporter L2 like protein [Verticillium longisporum]